MNTAVLFTIFLALAASVKGLGLRSSVICDGESDFVADPDDCQGYYQCWQGFAYHQKCSGILVWNTKMKTCDYPDRTVCEPGAAPKPSTSAPVPATDAPQPPATTNVPVPQTTGAAAKPTTRAPQPPPGELSCPADSDLVYFAIGGTCSQFYLCRDGAYVGTYNCAEGLNFSPVRQACVRPEKYSC